MLDTLKKKKVWIPLLIILVLIAGYVFSTSGSEQDIFVDTELVELRDIIQRVNASGKIQPCLLYTSPSPRD